MPQFIPALGRKPVTGPGRKDFHFVNAAFEVIESGGNEVGKHERQQSERCDNNGHTAAPPEFAVTPGVMTR
jgi:hypothetical protein